MSRTRRAAPPRCGAFADELRVVAGDEGGRVRTRNAYPAPNGTRLRRLPRERNGDSTSGWTFRAVNSHGIERNRKISRMTRSL
jgi:hypothetical protein